MKVLKNGYVELSESFNDTYSSIDDHDYIDSSNSLDTSEVNRKKLLSTDLCKMFIYNICCSNIFDDYRELILIVPESKREEYKHLEEEGWVYFDKNINTLLFTSRAYFNNIKKENK